MTCEELLELSTTEWEKLTDQELLELFGPAVERCMVLPGSEEEEKQRKEEEKRKKEELELEIEKAEPDADGFVIINGLKIKKKTKKLRTSASASPPKAKKQRTEDALKELAEFMKTHGIALSGNVADANKDLPKELKF